MVNPRHSTDAALREAVGAWDAVEQEREHSYETAQRLCLALRHTSSHRAYGWAALTYGRISAYKGLLEQAEIYLADAIGRFFYTDERYGQTLAEAHFALIEMTRRNVARALELSLKPWSTNIQFTDQDLSILHVLTSCGYYESGEYHPSLIHLTKAHEAAKRCGDRLRQAKVACNIGVVLIDIGESDLALPILIKSWETHTSMANQPKDPSCVAPLQNIIACKLQQGRFSELATDTNCLINYYRSSDAYLHPMGLHNLCEYYFLTEQQHQADWCLAKLRSYVAQNPATQLQAMLQVTEGIRLESLGRFSDAIEAVKPLTLLPKSSISHAIMRTAASVLHRSYLASGKSGDSAKWKRIWTEYGRERLISALLAKQIRASVVPENISELTDQELACLSLSAHGQTSADIGQKLGIKTRTVNFHFAKVLRKLNAMNRQEAIAKAVSANLLNI